MARWQSLVSIICGPCELLVGYKEEVEVGEEEMGKQCRGNKWLLYKRVVENRTMRTRECRAEKLPLRKVLRPEPKQRLSRVSE